MQRPSYPSPFQSLVCLLGLSLFLFNPSILTAQDESDISARFQEGIGLVEQEKLDEAITLFRELTKQDEELGPAWFYLGYALHMNGQLEEAIEIHKKAASFDQFSGIANYNLGCAYALTGKPDNAIQALETAVENGFDDVDQFDMDEDLHSLHTDVRFAKVMAMVKGKEAMVAKLDEAENHLGSGAFAKAVEIYRSLHDEDSSNPFVTYRLGYSLHGAGDLEAALKMHTLATKFKSVAPVATYNIACVHALNDNADEAFAHLNKSLDLGFVRLDALTEDPDLQNLRGDERFQKIVARAKGLQKDAKPSGKEKSKGEDL